MSTAKKVLIAFVIVATIAVVIFDLSMANKIVSRYNQPVQEEPDIRRDIHSWPRLVGKYVVEFWNGDKLMVKPLSAIEEKDFSSEDAYDSYIDWFLTQRIDAEMRVNKIIDKAMNEVQAGRTAELELENLKDMMVSPFISNECKTKIYEVFRLVRGDNA